MKLPLEYNVLSKYFDVLGNASPDSVNRSIEKILKKNKVHTVLDLTCGTGSQVIWFAKHGYKVVGSDLNSQLLEIAKTKAKKEKLKIKWLQGDMRTQQVGAFDAVVTIFNAVGHLTKHDFEKTMRNVHKNLKKNGIYVFDIFNLNYLNEKNLSELTMDNIKTLEDNVKIRQIQYSELDAEKGLLTSYDRFSIQNNRGKPKISKAKFVLQIYTAKELREMLAKNGFLVLGQYALDGSKFSEKKTDKILTVAKKV